MAGAAVPGEEGRALFKRMWRRSDLERLRTQILASDSLRKVPLPVFGRPLSFPKTFRSLARSRRWAIASAERSPCFVAFSRERDFPCGVRGPVDRVQGFTLRADERSAVNPASESW